MRARYCPSLLAFWLLLAAATAALAIPPDQPVTREEDALALFAQAKRDLAALGLPLARDIPLKFRTRDEVSVENNGNGGRTMELDGFYRPYNPEEIWVVSGLSAARTLGVMAHEMTHCWQSDNAPLQDRKLKEGFARWVQYHVLLNEGYTSAAYALTRFGDDDYLGGLLALLAVEQQKGVKGVIELARTASRI